MVSRGRLHDLLSLSSFVADTGSGCAGLITYRIDGGGCEVTSLNSSFERRGIGTALLDSVSAVARTSGCVRVWLVTTNDNLPALGFYQRRGFTIAAIHVNSLRESRKIKPDIPLTGLGGIPLRDEVELERRI